MKTCTKCILPTNFPNIKFNDEGVCNYCLSYTPIKYQGEFALRNLLKCYCAKGRKYDCIVPVSGGKDSTFVLYQTVKIYKMRVLAANYDAGFTSDQAKENLKNTIKKLGVDFVSIKSKRDIQKKHLRDNIKAWALKPSSEAFPDLCSGCETGYLNGAYKIAGRMGIPLIILGDSEMERSTFKKVYYPRLHKSYFINLSMRFMQNPSYYSPKNIFHDLLGSAEFSLPAHFYRYTTRNPFRIIHWFDYIPYDERQLLSTVTNELGWKKAKSFASSWRFDCQIHALVDYMFRKKLGFSEKDELYSKLIREGILSRDEAVKRIELEKENEELQLATINELFDKLGLSKEKKRILLMFERVDLQETRT